MSYTLTDLADELSKTMDARNNMPLVLLLA